MSAATDRPRSRAARWGVLALLSGALMAHAAIAQWRDGHGIVINTSDSLPHWAFFVSRDPAPARGKIVLFAPPRHPLVLRHFGANPPLFTKRVLGGPGDLVAHDGALVRINGEIVGRMKPKTRQGEPLTPGRTGRIPEGCVYAGTGHPDGFDSRYAEIGFVCARQVFGVGEAIL